jgi:hypothetical protein
MITKARIKVVNVLCEVEESLYLNNKPYHIIKLADGKLIEMESNTIEIMSFNNPQTFIKGKLL